MSGILNVLIAKASHIGALLFPKKKLMLIIYFCLLVILFIPTTTLIYYQPSLTNHEIIDEKTLKEAQTFNMQRLGDIVLPSKELILESEEESRFDTQFVFDPRLPVVVWLEKLKFHLLENKGVLDPNFSIPFSWNDWIDLRTKLHAFDQKYLDEWKAKDENKDTEFNNWTLERFYDMNCAQFSHFFRVDNYHEDSYKIDCLNIDPDYARIHYRDYPFKFSGFRAAERKMTKEGRILYGSSYLYTSAPPPDRIHFVGAGFQDSTVVIRTEKDPETLQSYIHHRDGQLFSMLRDVIYKEAQLTKKSVETVYSNGLRLDDLIKNLKSIFDTDPTVQNYLDESKLIFDDSYVMKPDENVDVMRAIHLSEDDFIWVQEDRMNHLKSSVEEIDAKYLSRIVDESLDYKLLKTIQNELDIYSSNNNRHPKHLQEAKLQDTYKGDHYDWRFFNGHEIPELHRKANIHRLGRAWLRFCYQSGITTFVAYGSMLGWIRNGLTLPWDEDIDVIVTMSSMYQLARNHNNSLIVDVSAQDQYAAGLGTYYLDIGPSFFSRNKGEGNNAIDGRFIDTKSGMYIDITAVAWTEDFLDGSFHVDSAQATIVDPDFGKHMEQAEDSDKYWREMEGKVRELQSKKQLYHCRNNNPYGFQELSTMVPAMFEGVRTHIPHAFENILRRKYPGALDRAVEPGHTFKKWLRLWVKDSECPGNDNEGEYCKDEEVREEFRRTRKYTAKHLELIKDAVNNELPIDSETVPMRYDEFLIEYARYLNARLD